MTSEFDKIVLVLLHEIEQSSGLSEPLINYKQYIITFELYDPDLLKFGREVWVSLEFHKILLLLLDVIERSASLINYKPYLLTFELYNYDLQAVERNPSSEVADYLINRRNNAMTWCHFEAF